jgi:transposase
MTTLTIEQIKSIPVLIGEGKTIPEVAKFLNCHERTINSWIKKLRAEGLEVKTRVGRPKIKLNENN